MPHSYQHWDDKQTLNQMFGDEVAVRGLVEVFLDQYRPIQDVLDDADADLKKISNEVHTLRSLFGIFNAYTAYNMTIEMDRHIRAGQPVTLAERVSLANELRAVAEEFEHFLAAPRS